MQVNMNAELWNAVIVAIDCDLDDYHSMGTSGDPELNTRYGKMLQARGLILRQMREKKDAKKFKVTFVDIFEAEDESKAIDDLQSYLKECVEMEDVTAFGFEEVKDAKV